MHIVGSIAWLVWVVLRTLIMDMYGLGLFGIDFERWGDDMIFVNIALPILAPWLAFKAYKWVVEVEVRARATSSLGINATL
jgi:hypothetical protein|tara:strand:- start:151 stop:393 length:243 start_codon:yes stop_codon:yes gene_type:complete